MQILGVKRCTDNPSMLELYSNSKGYGVKKLYVVRSRFGLL